MAEKGEGSVMTDVFIVLGALALLIVAWFSSGGPERADLRGIFLAPPVPVGTGESYGPQIGEPAPSAPTSTNQY